MNLLLGLFLGALLSLGSVVVAEFMRDTVLTAQELEVLPRQPVLASLPNGAETLVTRIAEREAAPTRLAQPKLAAAAVRMGGLTDLKFEISDSKRAFRFHN